VNTYSKVTNNRSGIAVHSTWGEVSLLSQWKNSNGRVLHRVQLLEGDAIRYTSDDKLALVSKGGA
jgi:hypothetical protein